VVGVVVVVEAGVAAHAAHATTLAASPTTVDNTACQELKSRLRMGLLRNGSPMNSPSGKAYYRPGVIVASHAGR
jgi:hypothetical protein